jgi:tight adherence protein C
LLTLVAVFGSVALAAGLLASYALTEFSPERRRLRQAGRLAVPSVLVDGTSLSQQETAFSKRMSRIVPRSPKEKKTLRRRLLRAGYDSPTAIAVYTGAQFGLPLVLAFAALFVPMEGPPQRIALMVMAALAGTQIAPALLRRKIQQRQKVIQNGLPDALDLLIVCLEAGSAIDQAIVKVSDELSVAYPPLGEELRLVITETRVGKPRVEAFRGFADRTGVEDVRGLVTMLVQTERFGTPLSKALRTHADTSRTKRRQRAEEAAAKIGVKLVFPLVLLLFPAFFVVVLGPAVVGLVKLFSQM